MALPLEGSFFLEKVPVHRGRATCGTVLSERLNMWAFGYFIWGFDCNEGGVYFYDFCAAKILSKSKKYFRKAGGAVMRVKITLACTECKQRNYNTMKNKKNDPDRLEMNKYCRFCKKHTLHKETK